MKLSNNFYLSEFTKSDYAIRNNIDNTPSSDTIVRIKALVVNILQPVREHFNKPVVVNSGYRSPKLNRAVGGSVTSDHMLGCAADIEIIGIPNHELAEWISNNLRFTQVILEFYTLGVPDSGWIHISYDSSRLKNQKLTAIKKDGKTVYLDGLQN